MQHLARSTAVYGPGLELKTSLGCKSRAPLGCGTSKGSVKLHAPVSPPCVCWRCIRSGSFVGMTQLQNLHGGLRSGVYGTTQYGLKPLCACSTGLVLCMGAVCGWDSEGCSSPCSHLLRGGVLRMGCFFRLNAQALSSLGSAIARERAAWLLFKSSVSLFCNKRYDCMQAIAAHSSATDSMAAAPSNNRAMQTAPAATNAQPKQTAVRLSSGLQYPFLIRSQTQHSQGGRCSICVKCLCFTAHQADPASACSITQYATIAHVACTAAGQQIPARKACPPVPACQSQQPRTPSLCALPLHSGVAATRDVCM